ncbi:hypothetical protein ACN263_26215 [Micromonospora sp. WMMD729]|uniref:hypothetical protein n=1 Tax=Micromonospora sp. WMMD729 TaxID=3404127 RepID=UPI003BF51B88
MTRIRTAVAAVLAGLALALVAAAPAAARADKLKLVVAGDGAVGVTIQATYADGRRLDQVVRLTLTAVGPDKQQVGPVQLEPAPEGQGFYSSGPVLTPGTWQVTVNAPAPYGTKTTATVQAQVAQSQPPPTPVALNKPTGDQGVARWWPLAAAGLVLVAAAMAVAMLFGRRRAAD